MSLLLESDSGFFPNPAPAANLPEVAALPNTSAGIPARELAAAPDFTTKVVCPHCHTEISLRAPQCLVDGYAGAGLLPRHRNPLRHMRSGFRLFPTADDRTPTGLIATRLIAVIRGARPGSMIISSPHLRVVEVHRDSPTRTATGNARSCSSEPL